MWLDLRKRIHTGMSPMVTTMEMTTARNTRNVGYAANVENMA